MIFYKRYKQRYQNSYKKFANFLLPQKIVNAKVFNDEKDNYEKSHINNFVIEKTIKEFNKGNLEYKHNIKHFNSKKINKLLQNKKAFAIFDQYNETFFLPVFNPINNTMEGLFIVKQDHHYIPNKENNFIFVSLVVSILLAIILYFIFRSQIYKKTILENNIRLRTVIEEADSGIAIIDLDGRFLDVNAMYSKLLGYSKEELLELSCIELTYENEKNEATTYLEEAKEKGRISKVHKICVKKDNTLINLEFSLTLLPSKQQFIAVINSIEEKIQLKQLNDHLQDEVDKTISELRQKDKMLLKQSKDASMGEMIDAIAHQWKTPLSIIRMLGQSIKLEYQLDTQPEIENIIESSTKIEEQVDHLLETLDEFRSFFRPKSTLQEVSVDTLINSVKILLKDELIKHTIQVTKNGELNIKVSIYPNEFKHVLINLITNSKDAFVEKQIKNRQINFHIIEQPRCVIIKMCDNAGGISEDILSKIFDPNFTTKEPSKGTGIGLYMTKQILDKVKAQIKVFNENNGACFEISIPK